MSTERLKIVILGGSALATPKFFQAMGESQARHAYQVLLVGRNTERLSLVKQVSEHFVEEFNLDVLVSSTTDLEGSLDGADYVLNQIRVGGLEGRLFDETFPRKFGIPGEETVGPGGFSNSLRGIPLTLDICRQIEQRAPDTRLLNLTNPSSIIQYAIRKYTRVDVIGTCDSPVSMTEMVASILNLAVNELELDIGGMHHFSWIVGARDRGTDRLDELLARAEEMPKLGTDPDVIRAYGAIPSYYFKYYVHPDRILAATEGRPVRASQLLELSDRMLEDFQTWKAGTAPEMVDRRGAVWYHKIVVPTLLALAEGRTTELILSVDNQGTFPWLPEDAIIEAPVPITEGQLGEPRAFDMPQDIQAMMARNCAYERLAAEAIAETDRQKALRALLSNLLVENFNQARGILEEIWPDETGHSFRIERMGSSAEASKGSGAGGQNAHTRQRDNLGFKVPTLYYGEDLLESLSLAENSYALITMEEPWELAHGRLNRRPEVVAFVRELDWYSLEALERSLPAVEAIVGMGGGTVTDAAKYLAWRRRLPVDVIPSITSVDAAVTKSVAARAGGHVTYIGYIVPRNVYVDYPLIQAAPPRLNISGVGDIVCAHAALWDWKLAHDEKGEAYDLEAVQQMQVWLDRLVECADDIRTVSPGGIRTLMRAFEDISIICRSFGSSRPQEASDHTFAYNAEFQTGKHFLHGELVALGTYVMTSFQGRDIDYLIETYRQTGIRWQPVDIGMTRAEFIRTMQSLNWYQKNFGRRYSILSQKQLSSAFIERVADQLQFD